MTFDGIIESLGERLGMIIENAGGAAAVEVDGVVVIFQDAGDLLLLRAEIGEIPDFGREAMLASAMEANYLYQGTGGATLSVDPSSGRLHIQKYNWMERIDPDSAFGMLEQFAATVETWRRVIADYHPPAPANEEQGSNPLDSGALMQV